MNRRGFRRFGSGRGVLLHELHRRKRARLAIHGHDKIAGGEVGDRRAFVVEDIGIDQYEIRTCLELNRRLLCGDHRRQEEEEGQRSHRVLPSGAL
jgi:hypothetical protein